MASRLEVGEVLPCPAPGRTKAPSAAGAGAGAVVVTSMSAGVKDSRGSSSPRPALGPIGEAAQLVEAALQARTAASQGQRFATTKTLFFALSSLNGALRLELRRRAVGQGAVGSELRTDCEQCIATLRGVLADKMEVTAPFRRSVAECFRQIFELCESLNAVGAVLDMHKLLDNRKASPESKIAALKALGEISRVAGMRVVSLLPESVAICARQLKQPEALVRVYAGSTLRVLVEGAAGVGSSVHGEVLKAAVKVVTDRCPEVRVEAYRLCQSLAEAAPNLAAPASPVPLEALVGLCVRGLDDESPAARLAAAAATGASLAAGVEGSTAENERLGVIAARDQDHEDEEEGGSGGASGGGGGGGGGAGSSGSGGGSSASKTFAKLKEMGAEMKVGMAKLSDRKIPPLGDSLTPDKVVHFLSELFKRATLPAPHSREYMAGVAEAFVCLWKRPHMLARVNSNTVPKLVSTVLDLLDTDRLPQGASEMSVVRTAVEYIVREGVSAPLPELAQQLVAREMLQILAEVAGSAPPASGFPPLLNEHQIQVCLVELSHLTRALGQACAALKDTLAASLSALLGHPSYGVRFEAAVALASLGSALPWCAAGLLQQCLDEIQQQYDALIVEGILPSSMPSPVPAGSSAPGKGSGVVSSATAAATTGDAAHGEADADLELDGDGGAGGATRVSAGGVAVGGSDGNAVVAGDDGLSVQGVGGKGIGVGGDVRRVGARGRSPMVNKRQRLLLLHGNSAAASFLMQVARELPMGIPSKVAENSFAAAEKLILVQFPEPYRPRPPPHHPPPSRSRAQPQTRAETQTQSQARARMEMEKDIDEDEDTAEAAMSKSEFSVSARSRRRGGWGRPAPAKPAESYDPEPPSDATKGGGASAPDTAADGKAEGSGDLRGGMGGDAAADDDDDDDDDDEDEEEGEGGYGGTSLGQQHPIGVVCTCVRTGWSLMSSLFCVGEEWAEAHAPRLMELWALCMRGVNEGPVATRLRGLEPAHELILLDASTRALLWFLRSCPKTLCMVPERLSLALVLMESSVEAVEGRLKNPVKKQGVICRTLLKALLMECFAWLPPRSFPQSSARLFKWALDHLKMYTLNDVQSSLLPELLHPDDAVLSVSSTAKVPTISGVGSVVEGEDSDRVLAQVALISGVTIGPQERDAMVCSAELWAGRGPSPARRRRALENHPPTRLHASPEVQNPGSSASDLSAASASGAAAGAGAGGGWRRPLPSLASINVRLLDAAVQVFGACFGEQSEQVKLEGISGLLQALPDNLQHAAAAATTATTIRVAVRRESAVKDASFSMPVLLSDEDRKRRERRHRLSVLNVCSALLAALKSMPPLPEAGDGASGSPARHNIDLPWVVRTRDLLLELLSSGDSMIRRAAAESLALMGLKVGDGYAVYLVQDLLNILRKPNDKKSKTIDRDFPVNAYRRAGAIFTLACLKRTMGGQVVLNWFWADVQRELSVGGDVVQPVRIWGLHAIGVLVKGLDAESNPTQYSEIQEMVKYLDGVVELLEAHFLGSWTSSTVPGSKRVAGASVSSSALLKDNQTVCADVPGLASVLAKLLCTLLPVLQALRPSRALVNRFLAMWSVLRNEADCRVTHWCLELVELLAMFAPGEVPEALPEIMPFVQGVLRSGVGGASPECLVRAAMCVKLVAARAPEAVEGYKPELELYSCLESVLGSLTWEGAPTWRGVVVSRDVERHFGVRVDAARQLEAAIETVVRVDQGGYRPVHWLLFGKALVVGTGHVQHQGAASSVAGGGGGVLHGDGDGDGAAGRGLEKNEASDWQGVVQAARNSLAMFASPLASSRWQVKRSAVRGCVMVLVALHNESAHTGDERVSCLDVNKARKAVNRAIRTLTSEGSPDSEAALTILPPRPIWARVPTLLCLYLEDLVTLACAASTASTDDSELLELQEAGVMMLTEVARTFAQVPDSDEDEMRVVSVAGRSIRASSLALELAISQITAATRPALGCKVSPRLAQKGCELVVTLVREGLVKDTVVLRRLVRQVMPEQILALSAKQSGLEKSRRRTRASRSPSPKPSPPYSTTSSPRELAGGMVTPRERRYSPTPDDMATMVAAAKVSPGTEGESSPGSLNSTSASAAAAAAAAASVEASIHAAVKESLRPRVSEVYGVHVPLAERSARLQCLAVLSLVAWGEDDPKDGGGSGSGAIIPDSVRRGLLEALREHLTVLGLHWLASVKDAVRLNQGDASAMWPRYKKRNLGAGLTYPPGVKPSFAKSQLKGRWPVMAAAAAAELTRVDAAASVTVGAARTAAVGCKPEEAARFLLCVSMGGLLEARDGLSRRRLDAPGRSPFSRGLEYASVDLGGDGSGSEEEEDEGHVAEQASHMFLVTIRCLLSKPELLGDPAAPTQHASTGESLSTRCERRHQGKGKGEGLGELDLPSTALVDVIRTLSSFPFLHTGGKADAVGGSVKEGGIPEHLQLAAVSVLRALVSGEGAKFIISSGERWQDPPGVRQAALEEREELEGGDDDAEEVEDDEEGEEWETGPFGLWEAAVRAVIGAVRAVLPQAFDSFVPAGADVKDHPPSSKVISVITATAGTPSGGPEDASSAVVAASAAASTKLHSTVMTASTVPLLHLLPNLTPAPERPTALPALLLLSIRVLGAVSAAMPSVGEKGESKMSPMPAVSHGAEALAGTAPGVSPLTAEGTGAVNFVRECVREVCVHGDASRVSESVGGVGGVEIPGAGDTSRLNGSVLTGRGGGGEVVSTESSNGVASAEVKSAVANGAVAPVVDEEEEDDWGDEDFQQADEATLTTCTAAAPVDEQSAGEEGRTLPGAGSDDAADGDGVEGTGDRHEGGGVDEELEGAGSGRSGEGSAAEEKGQPTGDDKARSQMPGNEGDAREDSTAVDDLDDSSRSENQGRGHPEDEDVGSTEREVLGEAVHAPGTELHSGGETAPKLVVEGQCTTGPVSITGGHGSSGDSALDDPQKADQPVELDRDAAVGARDDLDSDVAGQTDQISAAAGDGAGADTSTLVMNSTKLVQGAGRAVNALLESIMNGSAQETCAASISVVAEAWGAIALVAPREAEGLAGPLQEALASPVERCSVSSRLALFRGVSVSFQAVAEEGEKGSGPVDSTPAAAAGTLMRLLAPYALAGLRMEVKRAADAAGAFKATASAGTGFVAGGGDEGAREAELTGALLVEGVHVAQLSFKAAPQASHSALLGLLLPLYASALTLNLPPVSAAIGQALLYAARSSAGAFKEAVAYLGPGDRQGLEGAVRAAMMGKGNPGAGVAGSGSGMRGKGVGGSMGGTGMSGRKLDLSQYKSRS